MNHNRTKQANKRARELFRKYHGCYPEHLSTEDRKRFGGKIDAILGIYRKTKVFCSAMCCGNPRKWFGEVTKQEKYAKLKMQEGIEEIEKEKNKYDFRM